LFIVVAMWGVSGRRGVDCFVSVHCCCHVGCLLPSAGWDRGKKQTKNGEKNPKSRKTPKKQVSPSKKPMLIRRGADKKEKNKEKGGKKRADGQGWHKKS
jgi:hypothetical protein